MPPTNRTKKQTARKAAAAASSPSAAGAPVAGATQLPDRYAATSWGAQSGNPLDGVMEDVTCPSGQVALVRRPGIQGLVAAGVLDHIDSLTQLAGKNVQKAQSGPASVEIDLKAFKDTKRMLEVLEVVDKIVNHVVVKPAISISPKCELCGHTVEWHQWADEVDHAPQIISEPGAVYAYQVDIEDKMFLVNFAVGGTRSWERFRDESSELVERVEPE